ncbi:hypothetical protein [Pseudomonas vanderleydeniana]|uniref:Uncharacterized protein n=1 Tax=Pseudomonas vanderleydeniana TaxID=2745495 RepID=A0A9E6PGU6_9PSED|nr:hypothetical protein [Pseudomonas vanderleydeniana]QXI26120.1 hypothetical protein HU752_019370 [Pseudomonas vanderleydeniana]
MKSRFVVIPALPPHRACHPRNGHAFDAGLAQPGFDIYDNQEKCRIVASFPSQAEAQRACAEKNRSTPCEPQPSAETTSSKACEANGSPWASPSAGSWVETDALSSDLVNDRGHSIHFQAERLSGRLSTLASDLARQSMILAEAGYVEIAHAALIESRKLEDAVSAMQAIDWQPSSTAPAWPYAGSED